VEESAAQMNPDHKLFAELQQDLIGLHLYWMVYRQLFAKSEQRIALLNETGSLVFYVLQQLLFDETTLAICRLTDPPTTGQRKNQGLPLLVEDVKKQNSELAKSMEGDLTQIRKLAEPFRVRRNRAIAHSDLATKLKLDAALAPGISREMIEEVLGKIRELMNRYDTAYFDKVTAYEMVIPALGSDGDFLVEQIRRAVAFRDLERDNKLDRRLWTEGRYRDA
jgi:AbiU2